MKNAVLKYEYRKYDEYNPVSVNLGDYIQSIAAKLFYDRCDILVDRDSLSKVTDKVKLIGNGWYYISKARHWIGESIDFLPISVHINNRSNEVIETIKTFVGNGRKIGCRDYGTLEYLKNNGIDCYFSSCLTTTITKEKIGSGIVYSDFDVRNAAFLCQPKFKLFPITKMYKRYNDIMAFNRSCGGKLANILSWYYKEPVQFVTHDCSLSLSHKERFCAAMNLLKKYATAQLVVTSRIHCALPCLGLGTPVILVTNNFDEKRYKGLDRLFNHVYVDDEEIAVECSGNKVVNNDKFKEYAAMATDICYNFVSK